MDSAFFLIAGTPVKSFVVDSDYDLYSLQRAAHVIDRVLLPK